MKKTAYTKPAVTAVTVATTQSLLAAVSGGVATGSTLGNDYSEADQTYARQSRSLWDDDEES